ncbi:hypothetical protein NL50_00735 [Clostridium acetobutylicum]|nr:hypothetical protein NL50_00735 [Clostridium acetobutylicum]
MKIFSSLLRYNLNLYLKSNKFIMPIVVWIAFMLVMYSTKPLDVVSSFVFSSIFLFFLMAWLSFSYFENLDIISEQLIILKVKKQSLYYLSNNAFLMIIGIIISIVGVIFPFVMNMVNSFNLFNRSLTIWDGFSSLLLHIILASLGCSLSILFQPRCMKSRKLAIEVIVLIAIISLIKFEMIKKISIVKYIAWVLPPICDIQSFFSNKNVFYTESIIKSIIYGFIYVAFFNIINIQILKRRLF